MAEEKVRIEEPATARATETDRVVRRDRRLPSGRAVVGALLIAVAAVAVFVAYLDATAEPSTSYLVAGRQVAPGTLIEDRQMALELFGAAQIELPPPVDDRIVPVGEVGSLVGKVVLQPLERGELLQRSAIMEAGGHARSPVLSFAVPRSDAVSGQLTPGERIDVLATYTLRGESYTSYVVRGAPVIAADGSDTSASAVVLTVAVDDLRSVQALGHAVNTASIFVARSTTRAGEADPTPGAYMPMMDLFGSDPAVAGALVAGGGR